MDYSAYQQHHQQSYDSSQTLAYDQASQSYYAYNQQQYDQQYGYYHNQDQANPYAHHQFQQESASIHPPGVPILPEQTQMQNQQNVVYLTGVSENQQQLNMDSGAAAAAALSQLNQFAGNVDVAQGATHPPIGSSQHRGGGGKGSRPFRRGGRGHFNYRGRAPYRGRGRGRNFPSHSSGPANSYVEIVPAVSGATPEAPPTVAQVPTAPLQLPSAKEWCEICKVECNSLDILEQHKNGKRHKKNLLVHKELQRHKAIDEQQSGQMPNSELNSTVQPEKPLESKTENVGSEAADANPKDVQNNTGETSEVPADESEGNPRDGFAPRGRGSKRKIRGSRGGGKFVRTNDGSRRPVEPPKPKQPTTFICELCNVKCESQGVYDSHVSGKKHQSNLKRVNAPQASYPQRQPSYPERPVGLQVLHPSDNSGLPNSIDINALTNSINAQVQQGVNDPQVLLAQLLMQVLTQTQGSSVAPPSGSVAAQIPAPTQVAGSSYETQFHNILQTQGSESTGTGETKDQLKAPENAAGSSETGVMVQNPPQNGSVVTPAENQSAANEQGLSSECKAPPS